MTEPTTAAAYTREQVLDAIRGTYRVDGEEDGRMDDDSAEAPSLIFEVPQVRWPTEATLTLVRDPGLREGQTLTLTAGGTALIYRITKVEPPVDDDPDGSWTVTAMEWTT